MFFIFFFMINFFKEKILPLGFLFLILVFIPFDFSCNFFYGILPTNILSLISIFPLLGCFIILVIWSQGKGSDLFYKMIAFSTSAFSLVLVSLLVLFFDKHATGFQFLYSVIDLPVINLSIVLGLDGLGLIFSALTALLIPLCILGFWNSKIFSKEYCISFLVLESLLFLAFFSVDLFF